MENLGRSDIETWSIHEVPYKETFHGKICRKCEQETLSRLEL